MSKANKIQIVKYAPPPPELPVYGRIDPREVSFIGRTNYAAALEEKKFIFGIKRTDRHRHIYMVGKSGVGKSKLVELLMRQDIAYGYGLCLLDPDGDVIESILDFIPEGRVEDVVLIEPADKEHPVSFNPMANVEPAFKHQLTRGLIEIMERQFGGNWTPRLEHVFRFACLALLDYPDATLEGVIFLLTDPEYRKKVINTIEDEMIRRFWSSEFDEWSIRFNDEAVVPLINKLGQFMSDPILRNIFSQKKNKIDLSRLIEEQKIILINLSKGRLGEENSSFFGSMFVTKLKQAGMARSSTPDSKRKDFYLYVDEFHNLVTETFLNLLSGARKYGFCFTLAHQHMSQLEEKIKGAVLGHVGSVIVFRVPGDDAKELESELEPVFKAKDMINLGSQEFYAKLTIDEEAYDPFSAETLKVLPPTKSSFREKIVASSRSKYSVPVEEIKN